MLNGIENQVVPHACVLGELIGKLKMTSRLGVVAYAVIDGSPSNELMIEVDVERLNNFQ